MKKKMSKRRRNRPSRKSKKKSARALSGRRPKVKVFSEAQMEKKYGQIVIENNRLESFDNRTLHRRYWVEFTCPEFTCLCPRSGFPDFATIYIRYQPHKKCVELKSLKLYINSFRNKGIFHEDVANMIMDDLIHLLNPYEVEITADFTVRGNVHTVVKVHHQK